MSPIARFVANQANAKLSTGPRSPEGKARSAQNAVRHGLTGRHLTVRPDEQAVFDDLLRAAWNLRRIARLESELANPSLDHTADRLERYRASARRPFYRALRAVKLDEAAEAAVPPIASINDLTNSADALDNPALRL